MPEKHIFKIVLREETIYSPSKNSCIYSSLWFSKDHLLQEPNQLRKLDFLILPSKIMIHKASVR